MWPLHEYLGTSDAACQYKLGNPRGGESIGTWFKVSGDGREPKADVLQCFGELESLSEGYFWIYPQVFLL